MTEIIHENCRAVRPAKSAQICHVSMPPSNRMDFSRVVEKEYRPEIRERIRRIVHSRSNHFAPRIDRVCDALISTWNSPQIDHRPVFPKDGIEQRGSRRGIHTIERGSYNLAPIIHPVWKGIVDARQRTKVGDLTVAPQERMNQHATGEQAVGTVRIGDVQFCCARHHSPSVYHPGRWRRESLILLNLTALRSAQCTHIDQLVMMVFRVSLLRYQPKRCRWYHDQSDRKGRDHSVPFHMSSPREAKCLQFQRICPRRGPEINVLRVIKK